MAVSRFEPLKIGTLEIPGGIYESAELASLLGLWFESEQDRRPLYVGR